MVTKHQIKVIKSLAQKKYRQQLGLFVVEGIKGINEFLNSSFKLEALYTTDLVFEAPEKNTVLITNIELKKMSSLKSPNTALAVFNIPKPKDIDYNNLVLALDDVRDPGNLGTIIRLCDWFGVKDLICSLNTVDCYNSKVVQATMGSLTRVNISYQDLGEIVAKSEFDVMGTFMNAENIYEVKLPSNGIVVLGNEANGISNEVEKLLNRKLTIPRFGPTKKTESLNVANAASIVLSEFKRRSIER